MHLHLRQLKAPRADGSDWVEVQSYAGALASPPLRCTYNVKVWSDFC